MSAFLWFLSLWAGLAGFAVAGMLCVHYSGKLAKIRERLQARRMHEELDRLEMHDVMQRGDWR